VFALLLAFARKIMEGHASVKAGRWDKPRLVGCELYQKTMGVIGLGNSGSRVAQRARGFGMEAVGHDPYLNPARAAELHVRLATLDGLLAEADIVTLHVRATPETRALIWERQLERMKPSAILGNTSRGEVVNEGALTNALQQKRIAGACLDTFREEPLQAGSPLRDLSIAGPGQRDLDAACRRAVGRGHDTHGSRGGWIHRPGPEGRNRRRHLQSRGAGERGVEPAAVEELEDVSPT
jgi:D-3-phosphoglycerate dehydrogenase / 2-oxoglutarate reductase